MDEKQILSESADLSEQEAEAWSRLGEKDLSRVSLEHERELVNYLVQGGALFGLVQTAEGAQLRCLFYPLDRSKGQFSLGFLAADTPHSFRQVIPAFRQVLDRMREQHGLQELIGPMNGLTWFAYRLRVDAHPLSYPWEPARQDELGEFLRSLGFQNLAYYHSVCTFGLKKYLQDTEKDFRAVKERGLTIEQVSPHQFTQNIIEDLYTLASDGFSDNFLFRPISLVAFLKIYLNEKSKNQSFLYIARDAKGQALAFAMAFVQEDQLVFKTATTLRSHRRQGISNALFHALGKDHGEGLSDRYISALVFRGLTSEPYAAHGEEVWRHSYQLLHLLTTSS